MEKKEKKIAKKKKKKKDLSPTEIKDCLTDAYQCLQQIHANEQMIMEQLSRLEFKVDCLEKETLDFYAERTYH
tara:strand:+ start:169 stop:387 length:219 start_codon:yes stop_codon:yes gene_type:complete